MASRPMPGFFKSVIDPQSYLNILYLLLAFPLGTAYFVFLVTGLSLGFGLIITLLGIPILITVLAASWGLCSFERVITNAMLGEEIPKPASPLLPEGWWPRFKAHMSNRLTWTGVIYLLIKFPLGVATFSIAVTLISTTLGLLCAPLYYSFVNLEIERFTVGGTTYGGWNIDTLPEALLMTLIGIPLIFISLLLMNLLARLSGGFARVMLGYLGMADDVSGHLVIEAKK